MGEHYLSLAVLTEECLSDFFLISRVQDFDVLKNGLLLELHKRFTMGEIRNILSHFCRTSYSSQKTITTRLIAQEVAKILESHHSDIKQIEERSELKIKQAEYQKTGLEKNVHSYQKHLGGVKSALFREVKKRDKDYRATTSKVTAGKALELKPKM